MFSAKCITQIDVKEQMDIGMILKSVCLVRQSSLNDDAVAVTACKLGEAKQNNSKTSDN